MMIHIIYDDEIFILTSEKQSTYEEINEFEIYVHNLGRGKTNKTSFAEGKIALVYKTVFLRNSKNNPLVCHKIESLCINHSQINTICYFSLHLWAVRNFFFPVDGSGHSVC